MTIALHADPVPLRIDDTGAIRVGQSRVTLDVLLQYWRLGMMPEEIARGLDTVALADVHGALAYYFRHQTEIDNYLRRREEEAEKLRQEIESANASRLAPLKARLDALRAKGNAGHAPATVVGPLMSGYFNPASLTRSSCRKAMESGLDRLGNRIKYSSPPWR